MLRGLVLGAVAFGAVFAAERQFEAVRKDIDRYDALRAMSGESSLFRQLLNMGLGMLTSFGAQRQGEAVSAFQTLTGDLVRYAQLRAM